VRRPIVSRVTSRTAALALVAALAAACGITPGGQGHGSADDVASVALADADLLADPKVHQGEAHASLAGSGIEPITDSPRQKLPVTVTDAQGTEVTIDDTSRILALDIYGTLAQTVFELGLGDQVVGRDISTQFDEAEDLPMVTSNGHDLNAESILELDPTVILTDTSLGPWDVVVQMRESGIPVVVTDSRRSLDNVGSLTKEVAAALGVPAVGEQLADRLEAETTAMQAEIAKIAPQAVQDKLRMVFLYVRGQAGVYYMFGEGSGADGLIDAVGGYDVTEEIGWSGMKPVNDEAIVAAQPDLIIMMTKGLDSVGGVDGLLDRLPAIANTPAGQNRRVVDMQDSQVLSFGPRTAEVLNSLAVAIYAPESTT
jgi:iron complex transport system substrate-binding protein